MLEVLHIENIAVIEEADIQFRPGFNALTGETGAGKSIVIDAMGAYTHAGCKVVLIACRRGEAVRLRQKCKTIDPKCFMFITNTSEIIGKGFRTV